MDGVELIEAGDLVFGFGNVAFAVIVPRGLGKLVETVGGGGWILRFRIE